MIYNHRQSIKSIIKSQLFLCFHITEQLIEEQTGPPLDLWALGITLFQMVFKKYPYNFEHGQSKFNMCMQIINMDLVIEDVS